VTALAQLEEIFPGLTEEIRALMRPRPQTKWVSVAEAAEILGMTEAAVRGHVKRGSLLSKHVGRSVRVNLDAQP